MSDHIYLDENGPSVEQANVFKDILKDISREIGNSRYVPNEKRIKEALHISAFINEYFSDVDNCVVNTEIMSPTLDCGCITIAGKDLVFTSELLEEINKYVDDIDIIPNEDGEVVVMLGMYNMAELK